MVVHNTLFCIYIYNIYLISLVFSESGRLSFANGIDATHKEELYLYIYNIYLISLVFSESGRLSFANGIDATHKEELYLRRVLH